MKLRLIIEGKGWSYRLHAQQQQPGRYYVTLRTNDGTRLNPAPALGPFASLDLIANSASDLYRALVAMHERAPATQPKPSAQPQLVSP